MVIELFVPREKAEGLLVWRNHPFLKLNSIITLNI
jgi:hypothetical protein